MVANNMKINPELIYTVLEKGTGDNSIVQKDANCTASGNNSIALGNSATASGTSAASIGNYTIAAGNQSFAANNNTKADHARAATFGQQTKSSAADQFVCGKYNASNTDALFIVGDGTGSSSDKRHNAFTVDTSGNGWFRNSVRDGQGRGLSSNNFTTDLLNKLNGLSNIKFKDKRLTTGQTFPLHPNMIILCQGAGKIKVYKTDQSSEEEYSFSDLAFIFCTGTGEDSDIGPLNRYRVSLNFKTGTLTYDTKRCALGSGDNRNYIISNDSSLYVFYVELE